MPAITTFPCVCGGVITETWSAQDTGYKCDTCEDPIPYTLSETDFEFCEECD